MIVAYKFSQKGFIGRQFAKILLLSIAKSFIVEEFFRFSRFIVVAGQGLATANKLYISKLERYRFVRFLITDVSCSLLQI